jgi:hypothetical protein
MKIRLGIHSQRSLMLRNKHNNMEGELSPFTLISHALTTPASSIPAYFPFPNIFFHALVPS